MRFKYTQEHIDFLRSQYPKMGKPELAAAFSKKFGLSMTEGQLKSTLHNHKIKCGRTTGALNKGKITVFTSGQAEFIRENYQELGREELTCELNKAFKTSFKVSQVTSFTKNHKIISGRTGHFPKGHVPRNKGTKGLTSRNRTTFKKGDVPKNIKPLWSERICSKDGFILMKVPERNPHTGHSTRYKHKHVWIWEQENGPVPKDKAVIFIDGNKMNCNISNLMCVTRAELLCLNLHNYKDQSKEIKPSVFALAKLEAKAGIRTRPGCGRKRKEVSV